MMTKGDVDEATKEKLLKIRKVLYKELSAFIRTHGHFTLVEVDAKDGTKVRIKV
jgi:Fe-S cluster biogenesis protein NfuA